MNSASAGATAKEITGTVVDLSTLSDNIPPEPEPEVGRDAVVNTLVSLLKQSHGVAVEGQEGLGKTTVLSQFVRSNPTTALSTFISAANHLSFDSDLIRFDLARQIHWILTKDPIKRADYDPSVFKALCADLHRDAKRKKILYYFVVDGLEELDQPTRDSLLQQLADILPTGNHQFRFLASGDAAYLQKLIARPFESKPYTLNLFSLEESRQLFAAENLSQDELREIFDLCSGLPGKLATISRSIRRGKDAKAVIEEMSSSPEFFRMDWEQVPRNDAELKRLLALLAYDNKPRTARALSEILGSPEAKITAQLESLNFLGFDKSTGTVHFVAPGLRRFVATKLSDLRKQVNQLLIKKLSINPDSTESLLSLPDYLEEASSYTELLALLTPEHMLAILEKSQSLLKLEEAADRGFRSAMRLEKDSDLLKFTIEAALIRELAYSGVWVSEVEALGVLGKHAEAMALANGAVLPEDRLHLLCAFANGAWLKAGKVSHDTTDQIRALIEKVDPRSMGRRAQEMAELLVCPSPDLATMLLDRVRPALPDDDDLNRILFRVSMRAVRELKDHQVRSEVLGRFAARNGDAEIERSLKGLRLLSSRLSATEVIQEIEGLELIEAKLQLLRAWCRINVSEPDADLVAEYALELALATTAYTIDASVLADVSSPLPSTKAPERRKALIARFDGLRGTADRLGPSIDYVRLQLTLASAEFDIDRLAAEDRLTELFDYSAKILDLSSKGEAFARLAVALKRFAEKHYLTFGHSVEDACLEELDSVVLGLIYSTADQSTAVTGMLGALARGFLDKALEYTSLVKYGGATRPHRRRHHRFVSQTADISRQAQ